MVWLGLGGELTPLLGSEQQDQVQRTVLFTLVPVVVAEAGLRLQAAEGELKALRAQMNPPTPGKFY